MKERIEGYLAELVSHPDRHVGSPGNRAATAMFTERMLELGFDVQRTTFGCVEWEFGEALLEAAGERFEALVGPYSLACDVTARLTAASSVEDLESESVRGTVLLIHGELAAGQIMPKNFTFYNPESHKRLIRALEEHAPAAVVAATGRDPEMVGSQYPFPLFEDGDLDVPNAYMKDVDGTRLLTHIGEQVRLRLDSRRIPTTAEHVVATLPGSVPGRIVVTAHIDSRKGSPGALDNASGVAALLVLAELLSDYRDGPTIEMVPFNGEDNYANPGEMLWVAENEGRFDDIVLGVNIDDLGQRGTTNHVSFYDCPPGIEAAVRRALERHLVMSEGPQWFQSDHAIFGLYGRPAVALSSSDIAGFMADYAHSERDTLKLVDPGLIEVAAVFLYDVVREIAAAAR
ncbi:MAG TPA: M28 family peptidase [Coriobacteriia bacterium]|nr:M28 family peptidase [Coriobacteriia bacterium]